MRSWGPARLGLVLALGVAGKFVYWGNDDPPTAGVMQLRDLRVDVP